MNASYAVELQVSVSKYINGTKRKSKKEYTQKLHPNKVNIRIYDIQLTLTEHPNDCPLQALPKFPLVSPVKSGLILSSKRTKLYSEKTILKLKAYLKVACLG